MKKLWISLAAITLASGLAADSVRLTDGSSLSGKVKQLDNGDVIVSTGAGDVTVPKAKIATLITEGNGAAAQEGDMTYVNEVLRRRKKYGNEDGIPRTENLQKSQLLVSVGVLNYTGDAFLAPGLSLSDLGGLSYGLAYTHGFTDYVALEAWGDFNGVIKDYNWSGSSATIALRRFDVGIGPKVQKAIALGEPEQSLVLIPSIGISPTWSSAEGYFKTAGIENTFYSSSIGASINTGLDLQFGGALLSAKLRYIMSSDVTADPSFKSRNTSAWMPQIGVGFSF